MSAITEIYNWQVDAGNAARPYDDFLESAFQIEEALEGLPTSRLCYTLGIYDLSTPKEISRHLLSIDRDYWQDISNSSNLTTLPLSDVDRLDKACDAIVFAIGSMAKLGLNAEEISEALLIVNDANKQKLNAKRDAAGKLGKPADFVGPEAHLQELLNRRL